MNSANSLSFPRFWRALFAALGVGLLSSNMAALAADVTFEKIGLASGETLDVFLSAPAQGVDASKVFLALPPGGQSRSTVEEGIQRWLDELVADGWTIISPAAPRSGLFFGENRTLIPELLTAVEAKLGAEFEPVTLFGISNGGISALESAAHYPELYRSVTVLPGVLRSRSRMDALASLPVNVMVGSQDGGWLTGGRQLVRDLNARGGNAQLTIIQGAGHAAFRQVSYESLMAHVNRR